MLDLLIRERHRRRRHRRARRAAPTSASATGASSRSATSTTAATRTIDADGLVVAPGFVDLHTHYDAQLFWDPTASPSPLHGVTTVFGGNCGFTLAPGGAEHADYLTPHAGAGRGHAAATRCEQGLTGAGRRSATGSTALEGRHRRQRRLPRRSLGAAAGRDGRRRRRRRGDRRRRSTRWSRCCTTRSTPARSGFSTSQAPTHNDGDGNPVPSRSATRDELVRAGGAACAAHPGTQLEAIIAGLPQRASPTTTSTLLTDDVASPPTGRSTGTCSASRRPNPTGTEQQLARLGVAAERGGRVVALTLPQAHADPAVVPVRLRARRAARAGARRCTCRSPSGCARSPTPRCARRLDEGAHSRGGGHARGLAQLGPADDRRDVRARERRRSRAAASATSPRRAGRRRSTRCSTS